MYIKKIRCNILSNLLRSLINDRKIHWYLFIWWYNYFFLSQKIKTCSQTIPSKMATILSFMCTYLTGHIPIKMVIYHCLWSFEIFIFHCGHLKMSNEFGHWLFWGKYFFPLVVSHFLNIYYRFQNVCFLTTKTTFRV